jgi:hypothetical protein
MNIPTLHSLLNLLAASHTIRRARLDVFGASTALPVSIDPGTYLSTHYLGATASCSCPSQLGQHQASSVQEAREDLTLACILTAVVSY